MKGVNKAILIGNLGRDPELRYSPNGAAVANVSIATTDTWKDKSGQQQERTEWHRVVFFGRLAEIVGEYLRKGSQVYVEGRMETKKWQDKEGNDRYTHQIVAGEMQMLGGKGSSTGDGAGSNASHQRPQQSPGTSGPGNDFDDDIPFVWAVVAPLIPFLWSISDAGQTVL